MAVSTYYGSLKQQFQLRLKRPVSAVRARLCPLFLRLNRRSAFAAGGFYDLTGAWARALAWAHTPLNVDVARLLRTQENATPTPHLRNLAVPATKIVTVHG